MTYDAIVIGSGLAGLSAAFELAERGHRVLVLEAAAQVGGRTSNWKEKGMDVESGIHKFVLDHLRDPEALDRFTIAEYAKERGARANLIASPCNWSSIARACRTTIASSARTPSSARSASSRIGAVVSGRLAAEAVSMATG